MYRRAQFLIAFAGAAVGLSCVLLAAAGAAPPPPPLTCGTTITRNTVLTADLTDCAGPGLIIGAHGITLDLGGHAIRSRVDVNGAPVDPNAVAIDDRGGFDRVTVRNGRIEDYTFGVAFDGADAFTAVELRGLTWDCKICVVRGSRARIARIEGFVDTGFTLPDFADAPGLSASTITGVAGPIKLARSEGNVLRGAESVELGIDTRRNIVERSNFTGKPTPVVVNGRENVIRNNVFDLSLRAVIVYDTGPDAGNVVENNVMTGQYDYSYGILLFNTSGNIVRGNRIGRPHVDELGHPLSGGINLCATSGNLIENNQISDSMVGINVGMDSDCSGGPLAGNILRGNRVTGSRPTPELASFPEVSGDGIMIAAEATGTLLERNSLLRNASNGITNLSSSTRLRGNEAVGNGKLGIAAPNGAVDLGGNRASRNGNAAQCTGVVCRR